MSEPTEPYSPDSLESAGRRALDRIVVVLYQPQDLVNIALVVRAMKNMDLTRLWSRTSYAS